MLKGKIGAFVSGILGSQTTFAASSDNLDLDSMISQEPDQMIVSFVTGIVAMFLNRFLDKRKEKRAAKKARQNKKR